MSLTPWQRLVRDVRAAFFRWLRDEIAAVGPPPNPTPFRFRFRQEASPMGIKHRAVAQLPPLPDSGDAADIDHLEIALSVDGGEPVVSSLPRDATEFDAGLYDAGQALVASLVYVDAAGLKSVNPAVAEGTVVDETSPPDAGSFGFSFRQEVVPDEA